MFHCKVRLYGYANPDASRTSTPKSYNVIQCEQCFSFGIPHFIYDYPNNCPICDELSIQIAVNMCGHWMCTRCADDYNKEVCPICKEESPITKINAKKYDYFTNLPERPYFRRLYVQIADTYGGEEQYTYILCKEYHRFLQTAASFDTPSVAPYRIDVVWRKHLSDNESYNAMCMTMFGKIIYRDRCLSTMRGKCDYYAKYLQLVNACPHVTDSAAWLPYDTRNMQHLQIRKDGIISLKIKYLDHTISVIIPDVFTVADLKQVANVLNGQYDDLRLILDGHALINEQELKHIPLESHSTIHAVMSLRGD